MFYSKLTGGFYSADLHGSRTLVIDAPAWVPPLIDGVPDPSAIAPTIEINNPACGIPPDAVEITDEQHAALLDGQTQGKRIEADADGFPALVEPPQPTLSELKTAKWEAIKAERDRRIQHGGYKVGELGFHSDTFSRTQQMGLVMLGANIPANLQWKTLDGSFVVMTQALAGQVFAAAAASDIAIFGAAETHRAAMEASADPAAYDFAGGWPVGFGE